MRSARLFAVAVLAVTLALSSAQSVFAGVTITLNVIPVSATVGESIMFSGTVTPPFGSADLITLDFWYGTGCAVIDFAISRSADSSGAYTFTSGVSTFAAGSYSVYTWDSSYQGSPPQSPCVDFTVTAITLVISPPSPTAGQPITFSGTVTPPFGSADTGYVKLFGGSGCDIVYWINSIQFTADSTGAYTVTDHTGLVAGSYSALAQDFSYGASAPGVCVDFTVSSPPPPPSPTAVGGVVMPANNFAIFVPWVAVIGLVGCISTVVVVAKKREK